MSELDLNGLEPGVREQYVAALGHPVGAKPVRPEAIGRISWFLMARQEKLYWTSIDRLVDQRIAEIEAGR